MLSADARIAILDDASQVYLSMASIWEMSIKESLGKLRTAIPVANLVRRAKHEVRANIMHIREDDALGIGSLVHRHREPFDRMLIVQALNRDIAVVTHHPAFPTYGVKVIW